MNHKQKIVLAIGIGLILLTLIFPPKDFYWSTGYGRPDSFRGTGWCVAGDVVARVNIGYTFLILLGIGVATGGAWFIFKSKE